MKEFFKKVVSFLGISIFSLFLLYLISSRLNSKSIGFKLNSGVKYLLLGHSHPECAVNSSIIPFLANYSQSGESYYYTGIKCREFVEANPGLNAVIIEFTNNQINGEMDEWITGEYYINHFFPMYASIMNWKEFEFLFKRNPSGVLYSLGKSSIQSVFYSGIRYNNYKSVLGGYLPLEGSVLYEQKVISKNNSNGKIPVDSISNLNITCLENIVNYLKKSRVNVYFIRSPLHSSYLGTKNEAVYKAILNKRFPEIELLDFKDFPLSDIDFYDPEHLNKLGALKFTNFLCTLFRSGLMEEYDKEAFIKRHISLLKN